MAQTFSGGTLAISTTGIRIATSGTSASATIANNGAGVLPTYIVVSCTAAAHIRLGKTAATAVNTDFMIQPGESKILHTLGNDTVAAIQTTSAGVLQVSSLDNS